MNNDGPNSPSHHTNVDQPIALRTASNQALPPHPLDKRWFAHVDGQSYGPYSGHEIKQMVANGQLLDSDFVCPEGGNGWTHAKNDPLLGALFHSREQASQQDPRGVTANGGTVVQVTNQVPNFAQAALLLNGEAAAKSPGVALLLSLLICGLGQMYNGQVGKGILMLVGCILTWLVLLGWIVWIWSMIDAYNTAKDMNLRYQQKVLAGLV